MHGVCALVFSFICAMWACCCVSWARVCQAGGARRICLHRGVAVLHSLPCAQEFLARCAPVHAVPDFCLRAGPHACVRECTLCGGCAICMSQHRPCIAAGHFKAPQACLAACRLQAFCNARASSAGRHICTVACCAWLGLC